MIIYIMETVVTDIYITLSEKRRLKLPLALCCVLCGMCFRDNAMSLFINVYLKYSMQYALHDDGGDDMPCIIIIIIIIVCWWRRGEWRKKKKEGEGREKGEE